MQFLKQCNGGSSLSLSLDKFPCVLGKMLMSLNFAAILQAAIMYNSFKEKFWTLCSIPLKTSQDSSHEIQTTASKMYLTEASSLHAATGIRVSN